MLLCSYEEKLSSKRVKNQRWNSEWDETKGFRYTTALCYLRENWPSANYFWVQKAHSQWLASPSSPPSKRMYKKITGEDSAAKILKGWFEPPKYPLGSMVLVNRNQFFTIRSFIGIVIRVNAAIPSEARLHNKKYMVLPVGKPYVVLCTEYELTKPQSPPGNTTNE